MSPARRGARMRAIADEPAFLDQLPGCGWMDGGCAIYAAALLDYFGADAELAYVITEGPTFGPIVDHALVVVDETVYDGDGAHPLRGYLDRYARLEGRDGATLDLRRADEVEDDPQLGPQVDEMFHDRALSDRLTAAWRGRLGDPA